MSGDNRDEVPSWSVPNFGRRAVAQEPFRYATLSDCLSSDTGNAILAWFEDGAPWRLRRADFYEQYEFSCWDSTSSVATFLTSPEVLDLLRSSMANIFGQEFEEAVNVVCHRLLPGQRIGIHNDYLVGEESHRLVIQLNRGLSDADGGVLMLFNSDEPTDIHKLLRPVHLTGLAFEISAKSYHAVSEVYRGARYTIVFSLHSVADERILY